MVVTVLMVVTNRVQMSSIEKVRTGAALLTRPTARHSG